MACSRRWAGAKSKRLMLGLKNRLRSQLPSFFPVLYLLISLLKTGAWFTCAQRFTGGRQLTFKTDTRSLSRLHIHSSTRLMHGWRQIAAPRPLSAFLYRDSTVQPFPASSIQVSEFLHILGRFSPCPKPAIGQKQTFVSGKYWLKTAVQLLIFDRSQHKKYQGISVRNVSISAIHYQD